MAKDIAYFAYSAGTERSAVQPAFSVGLNVVLRLTLALFYGCLMIDNG